MIKDVPEYEGIYAIDDMGDVWSLYFGKVKKLKANYDSGGYLQVKLYKDGIKKPYLVHRLVAKVFLQDYSEDLEVDHIDRNRSNNNISNLQMLPHADNMKRKIGKGYYWNKRDAKWMAYITINKKTKNLGYFDKEDDAKAAYLVAKALYHKI